MAVSSGTFRNGAGERRYVLAVPDACPPPGARSLVVYLHGCTQDADDAARGTRLTEVASAHGWLVLYPEQAQESNVRKCWNWFDPDHQRREAGEPSIIADLTRQVVVDQGVNPARVFLAGVSAGAAMASLVAAAYPEVYAALALHSGLVHSAAADVMEALGVMQRGVPSPEPHALAAHEAMGARARVIPTLVLHGEADASVAPINGAQAARQWFLTNALAVGQSMDTTSGATDLEGDVEGGYHVRRSRYLTRDGRLLSCLVMVQELGHAWSGGSPDGSYTDPRGPDATSILLDFFERVVDR